MAPVTAPVRAPRSRAAWPGTAISPPPASWPAASSAGHRHGSDDPQALAQGTGARRLRGRRVRAAGGARARAPGAPAAAGEPQRHRGVRRRPGARSRSLMAFADELVAEHGDRLDLRVDDEGSSLDVGALVESVPEGGELYVCGPTPMLDAIKAAWVKAGRRPADLRFETFGSSG